MTTVAVLGASGFVGSTFVQRVWRQDGLEIKAFIHDSGNAWSLARHAIPLHQVDILSKRDLEAALQGCSHVVNCTRGSSEVMVEGLRNILECCRKLQIQRLVHLSSVAVYDGPFDGEKISETYPGRAPKDTYGGKKLQQDALVESACRKGLPSVVLCPPNISGAWSPFLMQLVQLMQAESFALVDRGDVPCNLIDVENLVHAIRRALDCDHADGKRIFVTDLETPTWAEIAESLRCLAKSARPPETLSTEEAMSLVKTSPKKKGGILKSLKHIASSEVRDVLRSDPLLGNAEAVAKGVAKKLPTSWQDHLIQTSNGQPNPKRAKPKYSPKPIQQQMRNVSYSIDRAVEVLGYRPIVSKSESHLAFRDWYRMYFGLESGFFDLLGEIQ